jgi:hypothetical protein
MFHRGIGMPIREKGGGVHRLASATIMLLR